MKRILLIFGIMFSVLNVMAEENVLQTIEIEPVKDTYNIVLVADRAVDVRKTIEGADKITLNLKDIRAAKNLNTVYNNVSNVDTVMVEPQGNGISIFFQAENASASTITFDSVAPAAQAPVPAAKKLKLNKPIEAYTPVYQEDYDSTKTSKLFNKLKKNQEIDITDDPYDESSDNRVQNFITLAMLGLMGFFAVRLFKRKEPEMKIGLSQSLNEREINMYKGMQPFAQPHISPEKSFTSVNYGINAYKRENANPYENEPVQFHNPRLRNYATQEHQSLVTETAPARPAVSAVTSPVTSPVKSGKHMSKVSTTGVNQNNSNIDNLKFLESMTAIYEKSGRHDLARGLKASLYKNNVN